MPRSLEHSLTRSRCQQSVEMAKPWSPPGGRGEHLERRLPKGEEGESHSPGEGWGWSSWINGGGALLPHMVGTKESQGEQALRVMDSGTTHNDGQPELSRIATQPTARVPPAVGESHRPKLRTLGVALDAAGNQVQAPQPNCRPSLPSFQADDLKAGGLEKEQWCHSWKSDAVQSSYILHPSSRDQAHAEATLSLTLTRSSSWWN